MFNVLGVKTNFQLFIRCQGQFIMPKYGIHDYMSSLRLIKLVRLTYDTQAMQARPFRLGNLAYLTQVTYVNLAKITYVNYLTQIKVNKLQERGFESFTSTLKGKDLPLHNFFLCNIKCNHILINIFKNLPNRPTQPTLSYPSYLSTYLKVT